MNFFKLLTRLVIVVLLILILILLSTGYSHYIDKLKEQPLSSRIDELTSMDNYVSYDYLPEDYINALVATEDSRFFDHGAIDIWGICRATLSNIKKMDFSEGGSTLTQQFSKNLMFSQDKNIIRKLSEVYAAFDIEKSYTKSEIIAFYANISYFGDGNYGIYDASHAYFEKDPIDLSLAECAMLAGIPNAPSLYAPTVNLDLATQRQTHVLARMVECGYITNDQMDKIVND